LRKSKRVEITILKNQKKSTNFKRFFHKTKTMNLIKNLRKPYLALILGTFFLFVSCNQGEILTNDENLLDIEVALNKFENSFVEIQPLLQEFKEKRKLKNKSINELKNDPLANEILKKLSEPSLELLSDYGFNDNDFKEMFGSEDVNIIKNEIAGAGLLLFRLQTLSNTKISTNLYAKSGETPDAVSCFLEATGIAAGVALVGALTGQAGGKVLRKAFIKAVKKIGSRVAGGFGLLLMGAEFAWCMTR
jgi:hypothetical protein